MDVTTMPSTSSLAASLARDFKEITFLVGDDFWWSPNEKTIFYKNGKDIASLLHETSHALLGHTSYTRDIELIELERAAWSNARMVLGKKYKITISEERIEEALDSYRDWLHARSNCPTCKAVGHQTKENTYACVACHRNWRVNDAKTCGLRRYII